MPDYKFGNEVQNRTDFVEVVNFLPDGRARFFMSCTQRSPSLHTKAFVRFDFEIGAKEAAVASDGV